MIDRKEALTLLKRYLKDDKLFKHSLAVEAILNEMAKDLDKDKKLWGLTGLLHDLDYEYTKDEPEKHATVTAQIVDGLLLPEGVNAIKSHNYTYTDQFPTTALEKTLVAADAVSGLIIATTLIIPSKKLSDLRLETLIHKFNDKSFAKGCDRNRINLCKDIGIDLDMFLTLSLKSLQNIANKLDL